MSLPIPGTGRWKRKGRGTRSRGVGANSRIVPHMSPSEGDKGARFRRKIRRREERLWVKEARRGG